MRNEKGSIVVILIVVIVLALIAGAGFFVLNNSNNDKSENENNTENTNSDNDATSSESNNPEDVEALRIDSYRKTDGARVVSELSSYSANNNGKYPQTDTFESFKTEYLAETNLGFYELDNILIAPDNNIKPTINELYIYLGASCKDGSIVEGSSRSVAVGVTTSINKFVCY